NFTFQNDVFKNSLAIDSFVNLINTYREDLRNVTYILSLSGNDNSQIMWSHYADQHQGLLLEYEIPDSINEFFTNDEIKSVSDHLILGDNGKLLHEVKYDKTDMTFLQADTSGDNLKTIFPCLFHKSQEWKYEREYRMILRNKTIR